MDCKMYTQGHTIINGRNIWHYLIEAPIWYIHVVEWEKRDNTLERVIIDGDNYKAEKKYNSVIVKILNGKM